MKEGGYIIETIVVPQIAYCYNPKIIMRPHIHMEFHSGISNVEFFTFEIQDKLSDSFSYHKRCLQQKKKESQSIL